MQVVLVMFRSDGERRSFSVVRNMTVIGRREDCDLRIPVGDVSRKHCRLVRTDDGIRIEDLGSSNGTHVNGQRVQESDLNAGDVVSIGPVQFIVQIDGVPSDDELIPPQEPAATAQSAGESSVMGSPASAELSPPEGSGLDEASEFQIEEEPAAVAASDEVSLDEAPVEEIPLEEIPSEEVTDQELVPEEVGLEEAPSEQATLDEDPLEEAVETPSHHDLAVAAAPAQAAQPAGEYSEPDALGEMTRTTEEIEPVDLEGGESEWDFVVEESDAERSAHNFDVDLGSTTEQPHGQA